MITKEQEKWINHLSDTNKVIITPYNPETPAIFIEIANNIHATLGEGIEIQHRGASSFKISGQGELDIYLPTEESKYKFMVEKLKTLFGNPESNYPLERARFVTFVRGTRAEIFVINNKSKGWLDSLRFESALEKDQTLLDKYRLLKEKGNGLSTRAYYRQKIEFINNILEIAG